MCWSISHNFLRSLHTMKTQLCGGKNETRTSTDLLLMREGWCSTRSSSRPPLSSSRLRPMSASWHMTLKTSSRLRNMENSLWRCLVFTRIASGIKLVETRSSRVTSAHGITNLTVKKRDCVFKYRTRFKLRWTHIIWCKILPFFIISVFLLRHGDTTTGRMQNAIGPTSSHTFFKVKAYLHALKIVTGYSNKAGVKGNWANF